MTANIMLLITVFITVLVAGVSSSTSEFRADRLIGVWKNQLNSIFNVSYVDKVTMELRGTYSSPSGTTGLYYPAVGYVNWIPVPDPTKDSATVISFSVHWGTIGSITSWSGIVGDDGKLVAQWFLVRPVTSYAWDHVLTGQDTFAKM
jgi:hypothetical protein